MFSPHFTPTPRIMRQLVQIERACGFLDAVEITPEWSHRLRDQCRVDDALSSVQIEGSSLTRERAAALAENGTEVSNDADQEFLNYYAAFNAIDDLRGAREYTFSGRDLHNILIRWSNSLLLCRVSHMCFSEVSHDALRRRGP